MRQGSPNITSQAFALQHFHASAKSNSKPLFRRARLNKQHVQVVAADKIVSIRERPTDNLSELIIK